MFTELLLAEQWRRKLESAGYRVIPEAIQLSNIPSPPKK